MDTNRKTHLVCALATNPIMVEGSSFALTCAKCGAALMVAPTGQQILKEQPHISAICMPCFRQLPEVEVQVRPPTAEQKLEAIERQVPNTWRERN